MDSSKQKSTILVISTGFLVLFLLFSWHWALFVSLAVSLAGILSTWLTGRIAWGWMKLAELLGRVVPNILLGVVFYLVLFPISKIYKLFNKDPLMLSRGYQTYFIDINHEIKEEEFEKTW